MALLRNKDAWAGLVVGKKAVYSRPDFGSEQDREDTSKIPVGAELTVAELRVGSWASMVRFEEFPGEWFNAVQFKATADGLP